ncbi:MAG: ABC transporter ATP-binding protein [Planctomycetota bacterium JB042]
MIELDDVVMDYGARRALDGLTLSIEEGQVHGLLGPNGAGKSTTIQLVAGLLRPTRGRIRVADVDVVADPTLARSRLAYVSESVALYPHLTGAENLVLFSRLAERRLGPGEARDCLTRAGLDPGDHGRRVARYSKGMRQKVGLAIALAKEARVLVLDEPSSGLDPSASHDLAERIRELASSGVAVLMATHDLFRAKESCDTVGLLVGGRLLHAWRGDEIRSTDLEAAYLEATRRGGPPAPDAIAASAAVSTGS